MRTLVFGAACALAGLGGVAAAPMTTAYLGMGIGVIVDAFVVVVIGGLGSIGGSMVGSLIVGAAQTWGAFYLPETAMVIMYAVMGAILDLPALGPLRRGGMSRARAAALIAVLVLAVLPWVLARHQLSLLTDLLIFGLFALSLDLIMGYTGMVSFGHAAYFGLGAYGSALVLIHFGQPVPVALLAGALLAGVVALPVGWFSTRATGIYFAMLTLAFAQLLYTVAYKWRELTGGSDGIAGRAEDGARLGRTEPRVTARVLLPRRGMRRAVPRRVPRPRPLAVRPRHPGHPRERATVHEPRA